MARKLNKALVAAVASVAVLGGGAYLAAPSVMRMMRPVSKMIAAGDDAAKKGDYETAALNYGKAASRSGNDIDLQLKFADAYDYTVKGDIEKLRTLRQQYAQILANDPRSVPALRRVLAYQKEDVQGNPADNAAVRSLAGTAERLEKLVPGDREARAARVTTVLEPFLRNLEVKPEDVDAMRDEADKLLAEKPDDVESAVASGQFRVMAIQKSLQSGDTADAADRVTKLLAFADSSVAKGPANAGAWQMKSDANRWAAYALGKDDAKKNEYGKAYYDSLLKAGELVAGDSDYAVSIRAAALRQLEARDPKSAEIGYRKLVAERPDDRQPRLMLAEFLSRTPARRDDAVAVLESPFKPQHPLPGMKSVNQRLLGLIEQVRKTAIRVGTLAGINDPAERKKRLDVIEAEYRTLSSDAEISTRFKPAVMRIKGGIEVAQNKIAEAINTLDASIKLMNPESLSPIEQDMRNDALMEYAQAELRLNQTGQARPALAELVKNRPENITARAMLADVLITERNFPDAEREVGLLEKMAGDAPLIKRMRLRLVSAKGGLGGQFAAMPEGNRDEQFLKLQAAATLQNNEEVARLAKKIVDANPVDPDGVTAYVQATMALGHRDDALAVLNTALKAKPDDPRFKGLSAGLAAETPEQREAMLKDKIDKLTDPFDKAMALGQVARTQNRIGDALEQYKIAQKVRPDDVRAYDAQFQVAVLGRRFEDADAVLNDLARTNADQAGGAIRRVQLAAARVAVEPDADRRAAKYKEVTQQAQAVAQQHGELATATLLYAQVLAQAGDLANAIDQFSQTLDKSPTNYDAMLGIAACLVRTDRRAEAADRVNAVKAVAPDDPRTVDVALDYDLKFGDPAKAVDTLQERADKSPDDAQLAGRLGLALEQVASTKEGDAAKAYFGRAAEVYKKAYARFPQDVRFLAAYAEVERRRGDPQAGEDAVKKAADDPANAGRVEVAQLLADTYMRSNKLNDAGRVLLDLVNRVKPSPVDAVMRLASILAAQHRIPEAMQALDVRKDEPEIERHRIQLLLDSGDIKAATEAVDATLAKRPDPDTYLSGAFVALRAGQADRAEGFANQALTQRPNDVAGLYYRGQARMTRAVPDLDAALADLTHARDLAPGSPDLRVALADCYKRRGDRDQAVTELQAAWNVDKTSKVVLVKLIDAYTNTAPPSWSAVERTFDEAKKSPNLARDPDVRLMEAESYSLRNDTPGSVRSAKEALALAPDDPSMRIRYFDLLVKGKAFRDVIAESDRYAGDKPSDWPFHRARGIAYRGLNQNDEARRSFDAAFKLASASASAPAMAAVAQSVAEAFGPATGAKYLEPYNDPALRVLTAEMTREGGDLAGATARFEALLGERDKLAPQLLNRLLGDAGQCYLQAAPPDGAKARPVFEELVKRAPGDIVALNNLACTLLLPDSGGSPGEALKLADRANKLATAADAASVLAIVQDTYGWALVKNNKVSDGIDVLRRASEAATFPDVFLHLAEAYLTGGDLNGAEAALSDAKGQFDAQTGRKQAIDPAMQTKYTQLTDDLTKKKTAAGM